MNESWRDIHIRGAAVAVGLMGLVAAAAASGQDARCGARSVLDRAQTAFRDIPSWGGPLSADAQSGAAANVGAPPAAGDFVGDSACAAQSLDAAKRVAIHAIENTVTMTTARTVDRNASHAIVLAEARAAP